MVFQHVACNTCGMLIGGKNKQALLDNVAFHYRESHPVAFYSKRGQKAFVEFNL